MNTTTQTDLLTIARNFIKAVEAGKTGDALNEFYHEEIEQTEYPNAITRNVVTRNLAAIHEASLKGQQVMSKQQIDIVKEHVLNNAVILEVLWTGTLAIPIGNLPVGGQMKAYFAQFFEFRDGKIFRQRNYDCFEPFS